MYKRIVVTGSLSCDHIMAMPGNFSDHIMPDKIHMLNVSFTMKEFRKSMGGTAGNIAYSLNLLKIPSLLVGTVGSDFVDYAKHLRKQKLIDTSGIKEFKNILTAQGFVITDRKDNQIWGFYEGAMAKNSEVSIRKLLRSGDFVVIAPTDSRAMIKYVDEATASQVPYLFDPAFNIVHFSKKELARGIKNAAIVIGNDYEMALIQKILKIKIGSGHQIWITTLGAKGARIVKDGNVIVIASAKPINTSDPTGAGDAFRSGFLAGYAKGYDLKTCGRMGALSAVYTVEKYGTQTHSYTKAEFAKRYKANYKSIPFS